MTPKMIEALTMLFVAGEPVPIKAIQARKLTKQVTLLSQKGCAAWRRDHPASVAHSAEITDEGAVALAAE